MPIFGGGGAVDRSRRERARLLARLRRRHGRSVALPACHQGGCSGGTGLALALRALRLGRARLRGRVGRARAGHPRSAWSSGFGVGGVSALRDATRANDEVASFGSQRVRSRRRRSVGGRERRTEPVPNSMASKKPRRGSRVRRGTNGARFAGRQRSCPRPPRSTGRARNAGRFAFSHAAKIKNGASEREGRRLPSPTRAYRYRAETMCAVVCDLPDARRVEGTQGGYPPGVAGSFRRTCLYDTSFHRFEALFEEDLFASKVLSRHRGI